MKSMTNPAEHQAQHQAQQQTQHQQRQRRQFMVQKVFLETAFEQRFQGLLRHAWQARSWHVIAAVPGSGKSLGIQDLVTHSGARKEATGTTGVTFLPLLAIRAPKNAAREQALGMAFCAAFGVVPSMPWHVRRTWLVQAMTAAQVECIIIDDAQDLTLAHLALLKELTDNLAAPPYQRQVGLCLVAASSGNVVPFRETFAGPEVLWRQFRRRMDTERPYCVVLGHTEEEVGHILTTFEDIYRDQVPELRLRRWTKAVFSWLTHPTLDPDATGRVTMDHMMKLVVSALRRAYEQGAANVEAAHLEETAELMILRRDEVTAIDGHNGHIGNVAVSSAPPASLPIQEVG